MRIKILAVGDVVGQEALGLLCRRLWSIRGEFGADIAVVNGENAAPGNGLDCVGANNLFASGADIITSGNHIWHKKEIKDYLAHHERLLRPANYPPECPGAGYVTIDVSGYRMLAINVLGTIFMEPLDCPFRCVDKILEREKGRYDFAVMDVHAEATSEKLALARYFDGRIAAVWGTHTHTPTADERILPSGTGFITDLGMTGPENSILGIKSDIILEKLTKKMPVRFEVADGKVTMCGALFELDTDSGACVSVAGIRNYALN